MKNYLNLALIGLFVMLLGASCFFALENKGLKKQVKAQNEQIKSIGESLQLLAKKNSTEYKIELSPQVKTSVNSILGSSKYVTLQYFFTLDRATIELQPDSTTIFKKP